MDSFTVRSAALVFTSCIVGCSSSPTDPDDQLRIADLVGTYALVAYEGEALPIVTASFTGRVDDVPSIQCYNLVVSGSLRIQADYSYVRSLRRVIACDNGLVEPYPLPDEHGTFQIDGSTLRFVFIDWAETIGRYENASGPARIVFPGIDAEGDPPDLVYELRGVPELQSTAD